MSEQITCPPELEELAAEVGDFICYWGFKKIHGRIWTHVYLSDYPLTSRDLTKRLGVSKALISLSVSELMKYDVVREGPKTAKGHLTYISSPDILGAILNVISRRERKFLARAETGHHMLAKLKPERLEKARIQPERLANVGRMISHAQNALNSILELSTLDFSEFTDINESKKVQ